MGQLSDLLKVIVSYSINNQETKENQGELVIPGKINNYFRKS